MAKFSGTAYVARTSHDQKHLNRLSVPEWGVVEVSVTTTKSRSLSYRLPGASTPRNPSGKGTDSFNFAPGVQFDPDPRKWVEDYSRKDPVVLWYDLHNPFLNITKAKLEIFRRFDDDAIWERNLKDDELLDGQHSLEVGSDYATGKSSTEWAGYIGSNKLFPENCLTVEHSPYKLRITVEGPGQSSATVAWTYFHILIDHLELEWGIEDAIPSSKAERRQPFKDLLHPRGGGAKPAPTAANLPVFLNSALFGTGGWFHHHSDEWNDNTLYKKYKKMWGDGPEIPLFCNVWIRDSMGKPVIAPQAIGKAKFLWDWESRSGAVASAFVNDAQNYDVATTLPTGQNCHDDRGGKRGGADAVFPERHGYDPTDDLDSDDFPFKVEKCRDPRSWAAYSYAWREKKLAGKTGVLFRPSRMAGDKYRISVYAAHETTDGKTPRLEVNSPSPLQIDPKLKAVSGDFEIWRRVPLIRTVKKTAGITNLAFANIAGFYQPAFLDLVDDSVAPEIYPAEDWNANIANAISDWSSKEQLIVDPAVFQHASGNDGVYIRTRADFHDALVRDGMSAVDAWDWMRNNTMSDPSTYAKYVEGLVRDALAKVFNHKFRKDIPGVNISQVGITHNLIPAAVALQPAGWVVGEAADYKSADENHCAFLSLWDPPTNTALGFPGLAESTAAHEFGHHFFLPHTKPPAADDHNAHDTTVNNCLMSYFGGVRILCGLCQLRLRGWDKDALETIPTANHKP